MKRFATFFSALMLLGAGCTSKSSTPTPTPVACDAIAKLCSDGSAVGRTGPNCEFAECPIVTPSSTLLYQPQTINNLTIQPIEVLSDSRCPTKVQCIWAGTVTLKVNLTAHSQTDNFALTLGTPQSFNGLLVTLTSVLPAKTSRTPITPADYQFTFIVTPEAAVGTGTLSGHMDIGPVCPVERVGEPCQPTPEMFAAHPIQIYNSNQTTLVQTLTPDASGNFSTTLPAGVYYVSTPTSRVGSVTGLPVVVRVESGKSVVVNVSIDTGIR